MTLKISVVDACFPLTNQKGQGLAATWLKYKIVKTGLVLEDEIRRCDIILVTCVAAQQFAYVKSVKKKFNGKFIFVGGAASTSPAVFGSYCDAVVVGDGQLFIETLAKSGVEDALKLPNIWVDGESRSVKVDNKFPWDAPPIQAEDGAYRLWCGRGCKKKCYFCQTGWGYEYSENPNPFKLDIQINGLLEKGEKIAYLSNDPMQHSFFKKLPPVGHGSFSIQYLKKNGVPPARQVRLGIEGVSERLRESVNKPISYDDLVKSTAWLNENKKSVRLFMIAGLPGELAYDWEELKNSILSWKRISKKGVLALSFTAWCPDPASPLAPMPLRDDYYEYWLDFKKWFFEGLGFSNRIKLMQPQNPQSRLKKAMSSMCLSEEELRIGGKWGPNDRVEYPYKAKAKNIYLRLANAERAKQDT